MCVFRRTPIKVATDCSGLDTPVLALRAILPADKFEIDCVFASEIWPPAREQLLANSSPAIFYRDLMQHNNFAEDTPASDLYIAGFPCQPFSRAGKGLGFQDVRGTVFYGVAEYLDAKAPAAFLLENVAGLLSNDEGRTFQMIMDTLRKVHGGAYSVEWRLLNTAEHGVPQNRPRVYILGLLRSRICPARRFVWPEPVPCPSLNLFLDPIAPPDPSNEPDVLTQTTAAMTLWLMRSRLVRNPPPAGKEVVIDIDSSLEYANTMIDRSMCMTRSREKGFWLHLRNRRMNLNEQCRLQGLSADLRIAIPQQQMSRMVGNAMSQNVLERLLARILPAVGLVPLCKG